MGIPLIYANDVLIKAIRYGNKLKSDGIRCTENFSLLGAVNIVMFICALR